MVFMLPGVTRSAASLAHWSSLATVLDVPGHGRTPPIRDQTIDGFADYFTDRLPAGALIVGESFGGLIALAMAPRGFRAVAFDPPLSIEPDWPMHDQLRAAVTRNPGAEHLPALIEAVFGTCAERAEPRDYWRLLDALPEPADVVLASHGVPNDVARLAAHPRVRVRRIDGPHLLLVERVAACRAVIEGLTAA